MLKKAPTDTCPTASAVSFQGVSKSFSQWQRGTGGKSLLKNLIKPEKKIVNALSNVSFEIDKGEFVAYAGPNGAGKSTTMKLLSGMLLPNRGSISVLGLSPQKDRRLLMNHLGVLFGNRTELWWDHPVAQSFEWKKVVWNIPEKVYRQNLEEVCELLDLHSLMKTFARELSLGQRMRADLALLLLHSPRLILLDEPTLGLDVVAKRQMIDFLKKINQEKGVTILVTSHDMDDLEEMARRILMIANGHLAYDGGFQGLRSVTGHLTRITVAAQLPPAVKGAALVSAENGVYGLEVDLEKTGISQVMASLSQTPGITDVEIKRAPIEQVIARLYESWAEQGKGGNAKISVEQ